MKKFLLALLATTLATPALAAQQPVAQLSSVTASREALRTAINTQLSAVQSNFDEVYAVIDAGPVYVNTTAPADTKVVWIDTDQDYAIKVYVGGVWTAVGAAGSGDNLGGAVYSDVVALWTTCTGYLKSDGTCDTPSGSATYPSAAGVANWNGSAWGTSYTLDTDISSVSASDDSIPSAKATKTALDLKANSTGITFLASDLGDMKILDAAQPVTGQQLVLDTMAYGNTDDALHVWSIDKVGSELDGKQASDADLTTWAGVTPGTGVATMLATAPGTEGGPTITIEAGTSDLGTGAIASGECASVVTTAATNAATTDVINWGFNGDPTGVTGYAPTANGMLTIIAYPSAGNVNFKVCNLTADPITPGAITLNWRILR